LKRQLLWFAGLWVVSVLSIVALAALSRMVLNAVLPT
jgi:hypothetical protein